MKIEIGISLGSNAEDRLAHLREGRAAMSRIPGTSIAASSPVYETDPVDVPVPHQSLLFLNACVILAASLPVADFARELHRIEAECGRVRTGTKNTPRTLDLDLIYAGLEVMDTPELTIPHPRWATRRFVVRPLCDVRPDFVLPGQTRSVAEILLALPDTPKVVLFRERW